jgi:hypothetical protein
LNGFKEVPTGAHTGLGIVLSCDSTELRSTVYKLNILVVVKIVDGRSSTHVVVLSRIIFIYINFLYFILNLYPFEGICFLNIRRTNAKPSHINSFEG